MPEERPLIDQINLVVRDVAAAREFYATLGVDIPAAPPPWDRHHQSAKAGAGLDLDLDSTDFAPMWDEGWPAGRPGVVIGFKLPSREAVDATYERIVAAGHEGQQPPYDAFWGARYAVVTDPDGNAVGLMSPQDDAKRSAPPTPPS